MTRVVVVPAGRAPADDWPVELVERKGVGHPDTLADGVAEAISRAYAGYCLDHFGMVANHWVDKCMLVGGRADISFGRGRLVDPLRLLVVGKITGSVGAHVIPVRELAAGAAQELFADALPRLDVERDLLVEMYINDATGAGRPDRWYQPRSADDLVPPERMRANDAVICCAYAPLSRTERFVLATEALFNGEDYATAHPEIGSDIKVLASRVDRCVDIVACIPFVADLTPSRAFYDDRKDELAKEVASLAEAHLEGYEVTVRLNTRDDDEAVYMTATGTAADTGDVGVVGRGNRANGLIAPGRNSSVEAPAGKNPTCHGGKIYGALSLGLANELAADLGIESYVSITTSTGRPLNDPDLVVVEVAGEPVSDEDASAIDDRARAAVGRVGDVIADFTRSATVLW